MKPKAIVSSKNKKEVNELAKLIEKYPIIGIVDMTNLPATQLQEMRLKLKENVVLRMGKKTLIKLAIDSSKKKEIKKLKDYVKGMPALILTKESPFKLANILKKSKTKVAAKSGQTAPNDIKVPAGPTSFSPGPIIGELGSAGIKAGIEGGKVIIKEDAIVVEEGQIIKRELAGLLSRLGIKPMEIGLNITGVYEDGVIYEKSVLEVDEKEYLEKVKLASSEAFRLAYSITYVTPENVKLLISKAYKDALGLAEGANIITKENIKQLLAKAERHAKSLNI
ncbi:50S ribosomal protein L10 [Candidatus Woesearchaeota archaeon]|nr:50S ribosomal protein L10 [Candidatus Woesearchaeota archaeon]